MQIQDRGGVKRDGVSERNLFSRGGFRAAVGTESGVRTVGKRKDLRLGVTTENPLLLTQGIVGARIVLINVAAGAVTGCVVSGTATVLQTGLVPLQAGFPPTPLVVAS
jgi:hypothetical protein